MDVGSIKSLKLRFYPSTEQKNLFRKCFGAHRFFYNATVAQINERYAKRKQEFKDMGHCVHCKNNTIDGSWSCEVHQSKPLPWKLNITLPNIRPTVMKSDKDAKHTKMSWQTDIPYDTRQLAIKDAITAYKACVTNKSKGHIQQFEMKYQKRSSRAIFWINDSAIVHKNGGVRIFQQRLKQHSLLRFRGKDNKRVPKTFNHDAKVLYDRGAYYLVVSADQDEQTNDDKKHPIVALDPGVRTFQTGYAPTGVAFKVGDEQIEQLKRLHKRIDNLRSVRSTTTKRRTKWRLTTRLEMLERYMYGITNDLHNQTISMLTKNFNTILLPKFGTSEMLEGKFLHSTTKRRMQSLSHYRFQQKLIYQCCKKGNQLFLVGEEYTTKTCGNCGQRKEVGSDKVYTCLECGYTMDRDVHGARNILIKTCSTFG
jgi:putative transposase